MKKLEQKHGHKRINTLLTGGNIIEMRNDRKNKNYVNKTKESNVSSPKSSIMDNTRSTLGHGGDSNYMHFHGSRPLDKKNLGLISEE